MSTVLLIPARGGSKSIPNKNVKLFCGRPLLYWLCLAGQNCPDVNTVVVATDCSQIRELALLWSLPKLEVFVRSAESATDNAATESVLMEVALQSSFDQIILGQCTSPLTRDYDLTAGLYKRMQSEADTLVSVARQKRFLWRVDSQGLAQPLNYLPTKRPRRQDFEGQLVENGAFYICERKALLRHKCRLYGKIAAYEMHESTLIEIDEPDDWIVAERLFQRHCSDLLTEDKRGK